MKILICSIMRNCSYYMDRYHTQLKDFVESMPRHEFFLSIYENDSVDSTKDLLKSLHWSFCPSTIFSTNLSYPQYGSIVNPDRVEKLAFYRNSCIERSDKLNWADRILFVESDVKYDVNLANTVIEEGIATDADIYSPVILTPVNSHAPVKIDVNGMQYRLYDTWATRRTDDEEWGEIHTDHLDNPVREFWSTFNGFCMYKAKPFQEGIRFSGFNNRLNKHDCNTTVICENFRKHGYNKILVNQGAYCFTNV